MTIDPGIDCWSFEKLNFFRPRQPSSLNLMKPEKMKTTTATNKQLSYIDSENIFHFVLNPNNDTIKNQQFHLINFTISDQSSPSFYTMYRTNENEFFIGSNNIVYRVDLIENTADDDYDENEFKFHLFGQLSLGPYEINRQCMQTIDNNNRTNRQQLIDNQIIQIFQFHSTIFVCGTNRCGLCDGVRKDFSKTKIYASSIKNFSGECQVDLQVSSIIVAYQFLNFFFNQSTTQLPSSRIKMAMKMDNNNAATNYDDYLKPINFISTLNGHHGSLIFFGKHDDIDVLYTAYSNDGRDKSLQLPFITARVLNNNGFHYVRHEGNECSRIKLESQDYQFNFIAGFNYDNFVYFLFMEHHESSNNQQLRLGRLCENDPHPFFSYMEITLKCNDFYSSRVAHLSLALNGDEYLGFKLNSSQEQDAQLLISFNKNSEHDGESLVCQFSMAKISEHFLDGFNRCTLNGRGKWLRKLTNYDTVQCKETTFNNKLSGEQNQCPYTNANRYIDYDIPLDGQPLINIKKGLNFFQFIRSSNLI